MPLRQHHLDLIKKVEGGYSNDPTDPGGPTNFGVTQAVYDAYRSQKGLETRGVVYIEDWEVEEVYRSLYYDQYNLSFYREPLVTVLLDSFINHQSDDVGRMLQRAVNRLRPPTSLEVDGIIGPLTRAAVSLQRPERVAEELLWERVDFYRQLAPRRDKKWLPIWLWRLLVVRSSYLDD